MHLIRANDTAVQSRPGRRRRKPDGEHAATQPSYYEDAPEYTAVFRIAIFVSLERRDILSAIFRRRVLHD